MAGKFPLRYEATGALIQRGDVALIEVEGNTVPGVVRWVSLRTRKVEVWVSRKAVTKWQARRRSVCRRDVQPAPWQRKRDWPADLQKAQL